MEEQSNFENFDLKLNESAKDFLNETAKWAYVLSILGYIGIGFIVLVGLFAGTVFGLMGRSNMMFANSGSFFANFITILYFVMALVYFFPIYYLNKFASTAKSALRDNDSEALTTSFGYLKSHYRYIGIMMVIVFSIYLFMFFGIIVATSAF